MRKKRQKGFTLTELAIVIAVIAILIAVLVPTFISLINSANESADEQAVKSMNTVLASDETISGRKTNPSEAMQVLEDNGFNVANYEALDSDNTIYWDSSTNRTLLYSTSDYKVIYPSDAVTLYSTYNFNASIPDYWYTLKDAYTTHTQSEITAAKGTGLSLVEMLEYLSETYPDEDVTLQLEEPVTVSSTYDSTKESEYAYTSNYIYATEGFSFSGNVSYTIDLNGQTITQAASTSGSKTPAFVITGGASLYLKNGTIIDEVEKGGYTLFHVHESCSLTLESVTIETDGYAICPTGNAAQLNIVNSTIITNGYGAISTNAGTTNNYYVQISIKDSVITANGSTNNEYGGFAVGINVPGTLNISGSTLTGDRQGLIVRGGTAYVTDTTITCTGKYADANSSVTADSGTYYLNSTWQTITYQPMGAVVLGNRSTSYDYVTNCTLTNVTLVAEAKTVTINGESTTVNPLVYMYSANSKNVNLTYSGCNFTDSDIEGKGGGYCYVNGSKVSDSE